MIKINYSESDMTNLTCAWLSPKGVFYTSEQFYVGFHAENSLDVVSDYLGLTGEESRIWEDEGLRENNRFADDRLVEELGFVKYSSWVGENGIFSLPDKITFQQRQAIKSYCRVVGVSWDEVIR